MKSALLVALLLVAFAGGWLAHGWRTGGTVDAYADSLVIARAASRTLDSTLGVTRADHARQLAELQEQARTHRTAAVALGDTARLSVETLLVQVPDTLRPLVEKVRREFAAAQAACTLAIESQEAVSTGCQRQLVYWRDTVTARLTEQRDQAQRHLEAALRVRRGHGWKTDAVLLGAGLLAGALLSR